MKILTRSGVHLSDAEFHGIIEAVHRRINRYSNFGHPDAPVGNDQQAQASLPGPPAQNDWQQMFQPQNEGGLDAETS